MGLLGHRSGGSSLDGLRPKFDTLQISNVPMRRKHEVRRIHPFRSESAVRLPDMARTSQPAGRVGNWLFGERSRRSATQQEMADFLGLSRGHYSKVETGQRFGSRVLETLLAGFPERAQQIWDFYAEDWTNRWGQDAVTLRPNRNSPAGLPKELLGLTRDDYVIRHLDALVVFDGRRMILEETTTIRATRNEVDAVAVSLRPKPGLFEASEVEFAVRFGVRATQIPIDDLFAVRLDFGRQLKMNDVATYSFRMSLPERATSPWYMRTPIAMGIERFTLRLRTTSERPVRLLRVDGLVHSLTTSIEEIGTPVELDTIGEHFAEWANLTTGLTYGIKWIWDGPSSTLDQSQRIIDFDG